MKGRWRSSPRPRDYEVGHSVDWSDDVVWYVSETWDCQSNPASTAHTFERGPLRYRGLNGQGVGDRNVWDRKSACLEISLHADITRSTRILMNGVPWNTQSDGSPDWIWKEEPSVRCSTSSKMTTLRRGLQNQSRNSIRDSTRSSPFCTRSGNP